MKVKELYARVADQTNMPVSTVGKVCRVFLCELASIHIIEVVDILKRYRIRK